MVIPCLCFFTNGSDLHCSCPVPPNRGSANGAPAGGAFLVDIPSRWKPRTKQQPTGLLFATPAAWPCCSSSVPICRLTLTVETKKEPLTFVRGFWWRIVHSRRTRRIHSRYCGRFHEPRRIRWISTILAGSLT